MASHILYVLTLTNKNVLLIESNTVASGATGHNAGQLTGYFERPFEEIVTQYGHDLAVAGQEEINSAWDLLEEIRTTIHLKTPLYMFEGLSGCVSLKSVYTHLQSRHLRQKVSHQKEFCFIAEDCKFLDKIPPEFADLYTIVPRKLILDLLETRDANYCAAFTAKKGCMNSAIFCEEVVSHLLKQYPTRFQIAEHTHVSEVILHKDTADVIINKNGKLTANRVVLCTNGFKDIQIINRAGETISTQYHEALHGKVGFMKAYTFKDTKKPTAISYYNTNDGIYFYLTRRPSTFSNDDTYNLVSVGGPEHFLADKYTYKGNSQYPDEILKKIDFFIQWTRINEFRERYEHVFVWHGLMGYTKNGLRIIGADKYNPLLLYNLGCNGVGILPSIFGGKKIALLLNNHVHKKSIFDPYI